jgi:hypothetical protein
MKKPQKTILTEDDLMPIGIWRGTPMKDVPWYHLLWIHSTATPLFRRRYYLLWNYIDRNLETLKAKGDAASRLSLQDT